MVVGTTFSQGCIRIPGASTLIRSIMSRCVVCRRLHGAVGQQQMADSLESRVITKKPPFSFVGVDYFGPFEVKRGRSLVKRYGVTFTSLVIRAVHIEVASSLDTDSFVHALHPFLQGEARFKSWVPTILPTLWAETSHGRVEAGKDLCCELDLQPSNWTTSWWSMGEVDLFRQKGPQLHLTDTAFGQRLQTALCEVESILYSRPITQESNDPNDLEALTPNHFLLLKSNLCLPPGLFQKNYIYARKRWRQVQKMD